jgi:hypothetical protein
MTKDSGTGNENNVTVSILYWASNGNDVTVSFCGNDAHLGSNGIKAHIAETGFLIANALYCSEH